MPGGTFTVTISGPAPGPGNADTYGFPFTGSTAPVLLTIYHT
jgi:hypothetical protein